MLYAWIVMVLVTTKTGNPIWVASIKVVMPLQLLCPESCHGRVAIMTCRKARHTMLNVKR